MEEAKLLKRGARANAFSKVFIIVQILVLFSFSCEYLTDGLDMFLSRLGQNMLIMLAALAKFNLEYFTLSVIYLIGMNFISIGALVLALIALLRYKNQEAKSTVAFAIILITATSLLVLGSAVPFY